MTKIKTAVLLLMGTLAAGCATPKTPLPAPVSSQEAALQAKVADLSGRLDLAMKENRNLRSQLILYKRYKDIDGENFVKAEETFKSALAADIASGEVTVHMTARGIGIVISAERLFTTGTDAVQDGGKELLDRVAALVQQAFPDNYIYIEGHTDNQSLGIFEYKSNWDFSFARALSVLKYLTEKKGFDPLRLSAAGFGQYRPRATNDTREGRRLNRRIEILITPQKFKPPPA